MKKSFTAYSASLLPSGFLYPSGYLQLSECLELPENFAWWFPGNEFDHAARAWEVRLHWKAEGWKYLKDIDPVPFARKEDWAAFFDGSDHSGNPPVVIADLGNKNSCYKLSNFDAWWDRALNDSGLK